MKEDMPIDSGRRYNENKPRFSLIKLSCFIPLTDRLEKGKHKYSDYKNKSTGEVVSGKSLSLDSFNVKEWDVVYDATDNWDRGLKMNEVLDSLLRHISAIRDGEEFDEDGSHIGAIQANAMFLGSKNIIK